MFHALAAVALSLVSADVGLHLESRSDLSVDQSLRISHALAQAIQAHTGHAVVIDDPLWPSCGAEQGCLDQILARTRTRNVVLLRAYAGPTRIRLVAERAPRIAHSTVDLPLAEEGWTQPLEAMAATLFPDARPQDLVLAAPSTDAPTPRRSVRVAPWVAAGLTVATAAVGAGFGVSSLKARNSLVGPPDLNPDVFAQRLDRMDQHGMAANTLLLTAAVGAVVTTVLFLWD